MTEQEERTIYEWAYEKLRGSILVNGSPWELKHTAKRIIALWDDGVNLRVTSLSPLDYNFAFGVCMPRLRSEGVTAWFNGSDWFLDMVGTENVWESTTFYDALLAYIEGVK